VFGEVKLAKSIVYGRRGSIGGPGAYEIPQNVDHHLWAGPAPMNPLTRPNLQYDWHWVWDTGNGELGNNNIHSLDICRWGLGVRGLGRSVISYGGRFGYTDAGETPNTQVCLFDFGDKTIVSETRGLKTEPFHPNYMGSWIFFGSEGVISGTSLFDLEGNLVRTFVAQAWNEYVKDTAVTDITPPPAPTNERVMGNELTWDAEADLESGLAGFIIERDGEFLANVPDQGKNPAGRPIFQNLQYSDTPSQPLAPMRYIDEQADAAKKHIYRVIA
jgi:hypothetical protein